MLSKFLRASYRLPIIQPRLMKRSNNLVIARRTTFIPATQYDMPFPNKFKLGYVLKHYWETIPLFTSTLVAILTVFAAFLWAIKNKVDVVFQTHSRDCISRTMDLRNPTVHKIIIINQKYEPWPEMQDILDKMKQAEKRALLRAQACSASS